MPRQWRREYKSQKIWDDEEWQSLSLHKQPIARALHKFCARSPGAYPTPYKRNEFSFNLFRNPSASNDSLKTLTRRRHSSMSSMSVDSDTYAKNGNFSCFGAKSGVRLGKEPGVVLLGRRRRQVNEQSSKQAYLDRKKKIRFKIPEGTLAYEDAKKAMWRRGRPKTSRQLDKFSIKLKSVKSRHPISQRKRSLGSPSNSVSRLMPVLKRLKDGDNVVKSELDLRKVGRYIREEKFKSNKTKSKTKTRRKKPVQRRKRRTRAARDDCPSYSGYEAPGRVISPEDSEDSGDSDQSGPSPQYDDQIYSPL